MKTILFVLAFSICALLNLCETDAQDTGNVTICGSTPCMNGGKCLTNGNPGSTYCDCTGTGYTGYDCREKIATNDTSCHCYNGGSCIILNANGTEWYCECRHTAYTGKFCEIYNTDLCRYHYCENGGICVRDKGFEYCDCTGTDFGGIRCDLRNASCDDMPCGNNGSCTDIAGGLRYCTCQEMYGGVDCEYYSYDVCPSISSDDMMFLPKCSLKSTLATLSQCINYNLPYENPDKEICYGKITQTEYCIYDTIARCSGLMCDSIYKYGGSQVYTNIANTLYDPESEFNVALREILCSLPENGSYLFPTELFNIGDPVCGKDLIDRLLKELVVFANRQLNNNGTNICGLLDDLRGNIYNITKSDCDWSKITQALPELYKSDDTTYFQRLLEMAQEYFLEWRVYGCGPSCGSTPCMNGGKCLTSGNLGSTYCDCTGTGYTGYDCREKIDTNDTSCHCYNGGSCVMLNGTEWYCECAHTGYTGKYCEIFNIENMTSACSYMTCYNGGKCYTDDYYSYCDCNGTGYVGSDCSYSTTCYNTTCLNGGQCLRHDMYDYEFCDCSATDDYVGHDCGTHYSRLCRYHHCQNGICVRDNGFEYCNCTDTDFGGIRCDLRNASCDDMPCENNGSCTDIAGGLRYCTCPEMYGGVDCQYYTYEMCPSISSDDMMFLPTCSLKSTLSSLSHCINNNLPYQDPDKEMCYGKITQTQYCIYDTIAQCSGLMCDSIYNYGGSQVYANIANTLYDPESEFNVALREILCALPENGSYSFPTELFNIGEPVCSKDLIDRLLKELIVFANRQLNNNDTNICGLLDDLRVNIYNITKSDCDWSKITEALPELYKSDDVTYFQRLLEMAQEYFLEWRVYGCEVTCQYKWCYNGGTCRNINGYEYCDCSGTGYSGDYCDIGYNQTACGNGTCFNGGRCVQQGYYIGINYTHYEYCDCSGTGYDGEYCDTVPVSVCDGYCANGGVCSETFGIPFCACPPGLGGPRCEMHDPTNYCRTAGPNDVEFLPLCTLRNTTEQLVDCVVHNMAGVAFGAMGNGTCLHGIHQTFTCVGNVIGNCSRSTCPSIYHLPGVGETVKMIVEGMFSPEVMYTISQYVCSPIPAGGYVQFLGDIPDVNLAPICPSVTLNDMVDILRVLENGLLFGSQDLSSICRVISQAQDMAYQLSTRCDMSGVISLLPPGYEMLGPYIQRGFNAIQNMLSNYTFPFCRGVDPGPAPGMCPMITYQSSQCEMVDAWMCQQFMRRKELSSWMEEFMVWWRTCSGFAERDWDHWASSMGLRRGDMYGGYGTSMGEDGFVRVIKANHQCTSYSSMDCYDGWTFTDVLGCTHCYRRGTTGRNTRSLFMMWMDDYQEYMTTMKIYNALRQDCAGSFSGGCGGGGGGGVPPTMPPYGTTPNTGSPWPWATTTMPYPYPEGTTSPQWPWASSSTPQWPWASSSTPQWPWPWTTASMPHPSSEKTTDSVPQWPWTTPPHPYPEETTGSVPQWPWATPTTPHAYPEESTDSGP